jgi:transposase
MEDIIMGQRQKHQVRLIKQERALLIEKTSSGRWPARKIKRAQVLLKADKNQDNPQQDWEIAEDLYCHRTMVTKLRERFAKEGLNCLDDKPRTGRRRKFDGDVEAHVIAIACSAPPEGHERWTLRLIANRIVALTEGGCSHTSVGTILKKMNLSLG